MKCETYMMWYTLSGWSFGLWLTGCVCVCMCVCVVCKSGFQSQQLLIIRMSYLLVVLAVVLVPVVAQNNHSLSCPSAVGQVSR